MPLLTGIDVQSGLQNCGGNQDLYLRLLKRFRDGERDFAERLRSTAQDGDLDTAVRHAHTLKGASGTIGAVELQSAAATLEQALINRDDIEARFEDCLLLLGPVLQVLEELNPAEQVEAGSGNPTQLISALRIAIEENDAEAVEIGNKLSQHPLGQSHSTTITELLSYLAEYDFDRSLEILERLDRDMSND